MPAFTPSLPMLKLLPSVANNQTSLPAERVINRQALLEIAPDREALFAKTRTIDDIRHSLKIRSVSNHGWLYQSHQRIDMKLRDPTTRTSTFILRPFDATAGENQPPNDAQHHTRRRVMSASDINVYPLTSSGIDNRLLEGARNWGNINLSTSDKLVSPRPLGATHILVVFSSSQGHQLHLELPINDLLFVLNVPNLAKPHLFPHRLPFELPRVRMQVRHLETFPELVVYLHTKNQAELFRKIIPEWIRDLMHPLPVAPAELPVAKTEATKRRRSQLFTWTGSPASSTDNLIRARSTRPVPRLLERTVDSIAKEIAETDIGTKWGPGTESDPLITTSTRLNALRDNLEDVGFYSRQLWSELDMSVEILKGALNWKARMAGTGGEDD